jgi:type VI protein secretion system component VasK
VGAVSTVPENLARAIDENSRELRELKVEVQGERADRQAERKRDRRQFLIILTSVITAALLVMLLGFLWNRSAIEANNAKFCRWLDSTSQTDDNASDPPNTAGRRAARDAAQLAKDFGCD